ncbi:MAG: NIL domain-containing protein [Gammaproteobacteria bacterium]|nr:FeS-binding protein [Chloroflexota bacterium]MCH2669956.1 NIL domain-containing protein [Gammaproteobacteria bacterium]
MRRVRLTYLDHMIRQPVIYQMGKDFDVVTNIRRADIQENIAWVILELEGDEIEIDNALEWASSLGVRVDPALGDLVEG